MRPERVRAARVDHELAVRAGGLWATARKGGVLLVATKAVKAQDEGSVLAAKGSDDRRRRRCRSPDIPIGRQATGPESRAYAIGRPASSTFECWKT